ncbi:MAG: glycosyltransferase [bacterium]
MSEQGPLLICAEFFPPMLGGSPILSRNLWGEWPASDLVVISRMDHRQQFDPKTELPNIRIHYILAWLSSLPRVRAALEPLMGIPVKWQIIKLAKECKPRAIWVNWPGTGFLLGAWWASRKLRIPLYVHMHDMMDERRPSVKRILGWWAAGFYEKRILQGAARVFAITDTAADYFREKFGIDVYVLKHCIPDLDIEKIRLPGKRDIKNVIHFAGGIYPVMNLDAVVDLVKALDLCQSGITLDGYTMYPAGYEALGIGGSRVSLRRASKAEVMAAQRESAIMFLPLAFQSPNPVEIRTVFPTKLLEYLVSGRPILVHAPADSWVSRAARRDGWGEVVDTPDPKQLANAIDALLNDEAKQKSLVAAAYREARNRLASTVSSELQRELKGLEKRGKNRAV